MKYFFTVLVVVISFQVTAQQFNGIDNQQAKVLVGTWIGTSVFTDFEEGKMQSTFTTTLQVNDLKDSLQFNFEHTGRDGKKWTSTTYLNFYDEKKKLSFDNYEFSIESSTRRGPNVTIYGDRNGHVNYRQADFLQTIIFSPSKLSIIKEKRFMDMVSFSIDYRMTLSKK